YLTKFSATRRMKRDAKIAEGFPDLVRRAVGLPIGKEGAYFVGALGAWGMDHDASVLDFNLPPWGQPGLWCKWAPDRGGRAIIWNGAEKFYSYVEWLEYLIKHFLKPWGYVLNGEVPWQGEDHEDRGVLVVTENAVKAHPAY